MRAAPRPLRPYAALAFALPRAVACHACVDPPPPNGATTAPPAVATEAPARAPEPVAPPEPLASTASTPAVSSPATGCARYLCDASSLLSCASTDEERIAAIDQLERCGHEYPSQRDGYRKAMLGVAFHDGTMAVQVGERLVQAGVVSREQVKPITAPGDELRRLIAAHVKKLSSAQARRGGPPSPAPPRAALAISVRDCGLTVGTQSGSVELRCAIRGGCIGGCRRERVSAAFHVEAAGLRLSEVKDDSVDDGSCGCCM